MMKAVDHTKNTILKKDSLAVTVWIFMLCLMHEMEFLMSGIEIFDKFSVVMFTGLVLALLVLAYSIKALWLYSLFTSSCLLLFAIHLSLSTGGDWYFFIICAAISWLCGLCHESMANLVFLIVSNVLTGSLALLGIPLMGPVFSYTITITFWGISLFFSIFLFLITHRASLNKREAFEAIGYFETLLSSTPNCIALIDAWQATLYISKKMAETFHIPCSDLVVGRPFTDLLDNRELRSRLIRVIHENEPYENTWEILVEEQMRYYQIIYQEFHDKLMPGHFLCLNDVTNIMLSKIEAERNAHTKSIFLANTSHEIRTPMNAILGMVELILRKDISPDVYEDAITIKQSGENLLSIINDILDFSKIESGKFEITPATYQFASLIHDVVNIIRVKLSDKPILFIVNVDNHLPKELYGDISRVRQVLLNLLSNAVKFTTEGYISLFVSGETVPGESTIKLYFEVTDTGFGIRREELSKLFGDFVQLTARPSVEGTGLGLAISRSLCRLMGGDITVVSEFGAGSTFTASVIQEIRNTADFAVVENPQSKSVLVYDDRQVYAESISRSIFDLGAKCYIALNKDSLTEMLKRRSYEFIFINSALYKNARSTVRLLAGNAVIGVLTEQNEIAMFPESVTITTPAYAISLANVLNGNNEEDGFMQSTGPRIRFSAPDARILLVDDVPTNLKVARGLVAPYRVKVDTALSGEEGIRLVNKNHYDLVFMDHMMPVMDGVDAMHRIREQGGAYSRLPIVVLTANAVVGMKEKFLKEGFNDYLSKPIDTLRLDEVLFRWIPRAKHQSPQKGEGQNARDIMRNGILIDGIDTVEGVRMANGSMESYLDILSVYVKDGRNRLDILTHLAADMDTGNHDKKFCADVGMQAHALKSASASIGAKKLAEEALNLEMAGKADALEFIKLNLSAFCAELSDLIDRVDAVVPHSNAVESAVQPQGEALLTGDEREQFLRLKEALDDENIGAVDSLFDDLKRKAGSALKGKLEVISDHILVAEFKEAAEIVEELCQ